MQVSVRALYVASNELTMCIERQLLAGTGMSSAWLAVAKADI